MALTGRRLPRAPGVEAARPGPACLQELRAGPGRVNAGDRKELQAAIQGGAPLALSLRYAHALGSPIHGMEQVLRSLELRLQPAGHADFKSPVLSSDTVPCSLG